MKVSEISRAALSVDKPLSIAILAMGGQGGGVLADWIVALAEAQGWVAQSTSVPGVAQRTGATIYYIEMLATHGGRLPTLSLMPSPGDVDIVLAAEFMEAGRSILRGLVTPDRTTLIASTHRAYAVVEKEKPGDGIGNPVLVGDATDIAAKKTIAFDMQTLAENNGSVISSALFGALAAAKVLPFDRESFENTIKAGGKGVEASLRTFAAAHDRAREKPRDPILQSAPKRFDAMPKATGHAELDVLLARIRTAFPEVAHAMLFAGVKKLVDFQDPAYATTYLDRMGKLHAQDLAHGESGNGYSFTIEAAKYLAVAMAYDDVIRVADLKIRPSRIERVRHEVGAKADQLVYTTEFMHPRMDEVCGSLPAVIGHAIENRPALFKALDRVVNRGRRVRTGTIRWFLVLYVLGGLKRFRRGTLRHEREVAHRDAWLARVSAAAGGDYALALELAANRRLVKGYSDTHARGQSKFDEVMAAAARLQGRPDAADWVQRLRAAALKDEDGIALAGAIKTIDSFL
jgi:indolepyruvate ferredoxin oxidoreductase, beta subunit